jgi:hypothetical protein
MKIKILAIATGVLLAVSFSLAAGAGTIADFDVDLIPDVFDNCSEKVNGPGTGGANADQADEDSDGFGNACDCDFTQDGTVLVDDISSLFGAFNGPSLLHDNTGDGTVLVDDVSFCFGQFNGPPGPGATAI